MSRTLILRNVRISLKDDGSMHIVGKSAEMEHHSFWSAFEVEQLKDFLNQRQLYDDGQIGEARRTGCCTKKENASAEGQAPADTSLTTELSVSPSLAAKILKLVEKENKRTPRKSRKTRSKR